MYVEAVHKSSQGASCNSEHKQEKRNLYVTDFEDTADALNLEISDSIPEPEFNFNPFTYFDKLGESTFKQVCFDHILIVSILTQKLSYFCSLILIEDIGRLFFKNQLNLFVK